MESGTSTIGVLTPSKGSVGRGFCSVLRAGYFSFRLSLILLAFVVRTPDLVAQQGPWKVAERHGNIELYSEVPVDTRRIWAEIDQLTEELNQTVSVQPHFTTCGSTAVDTAARMVWYYQHAMGRPQKTDIVARENSYHGATFLTQSIGKRAGDRVEEFRYKTDGIHHLCPAPIPIAAPKA